MHINRFSLTSILGFLVPLVCCVVRLPNLLARPSSCIWEWLVCDLGTALGVSGGGVLEGSFLRRNPENGSRPATHFLGVPVRSNWISFLNRNLGNHVEQLPNGITQTVWQWRASSQERGINKKQQRNWEQMLNSMCMCVGGVGRTHVCCKQAVPKRRPCVCVCVCGRSFRRQGDFQTPEILWELDVTQRRCDMRHELLTQRALCIGVNAKKGTLSQHFVAHVVRCQASQGWLSKLWAV